MPAITARVRPPVILAMVLVLGAMAAARGQEAPLSLPLSPTQPPDSLPWLGGYTVLPAQRPVGGLETLSAADFAAIQRRLIQLGYDPGLPDGTPRPATLHAVAQWQADTGLVPDGVPTLGIERRLDRQVKKAIAARGTSPIARWRRDLLGRPVVGPGGVIAGRVGEVTIDSSGAIADVIVFVAQPSGGAVRRVPLPWAWVAPQIGRPVLRVPWRAEDMLWVTGSGGKAPPALGGRKPGWLDGAPALTADGASVGTVSGFLFAPDGQVAAVMVDVGGGQEIAIPRPDIRVERQAGLDRVVVTLSRQGLAALPRRPAGAEPPVAAVPGRQ